MRSESRALGFVALVIALSAGARLLDRGPSVVSGAALDMEALEAASRAALEEAQERARPLEPGERIDVNAASAAELERLPGVGASIAGRIVMERDRGGAFGEASDLTRVSGIGERTVERLAPHVSFGAASGPRVRRPSPSGDAGRPASRYDLIPAGGAGPRPARTGGSVVLVGEIDVNRADTAALQQIPGIGPVLAGRIIAYRDSVGPFSELDDLEEVPGIGPGTLERMRRW